MRELVSTAWTVVFAITLRNKLFHCDAYIYSLLLRCSIGMPGYILFLSPFFHHDPQIYSLPLHCTIVMPRYIHLSSLYHWGALIYSPLFVVPLWSPDLFTSLRSSIVVPGSIRLSLFLSLSLSLFHWCARSIYFCPLFHWCAKIYSFLSSLYHHDPQIYSLPLHCSIVMSKSIHFSPLFHCDAHHA